MQTTTKTRRAIGGTQGRLYQSRDREGAGKAMTNYELPMAAGTVLSFRIIHRQDAGATHGGAALGHATRRAIDNRKSQIDNTIVRSLCARGSYSIDNRQSHCPLPHGRGSVHCGRGSYRRAQPALLVGARLVVVGLLLLLGAQPAASYALVPDDCNCFGDLTGSGTVDFDDQLMFENDCLPMGFPVNGCENADLNCDGVVDEIDLKRIKCQVENPEDPYSCCELCFDDIECSDGNPCNGEEKCILGDCHNAVLTEEEDCNQSGQHDSCDIAQFLSFDCNLDGIPDECQQGELTASEPFAEELRDDQAEFSANRATLSSEVYYRNVLTEVVYAPKKSSGRFGLGQAIGDDGGNVSSITYLEGATATLTVLGTEIYFNGTPVPVTLEYRIDDGAWQAVNGGVAFHIVEPFTGPTATINLGGNPEGELYFRASTSFVTVDTSPGGMNHNNAVVLMPGESFDDAMAQYGNPEPFGPQLPIGCFIAPYVTTPPPHTIVAPAGSVLAFFELGSTNPAAAAFDLQDLVLVITPD